MTWTHTRKEKFNLHGFLTSSLDGCLQYISHSSYFLPSQKKPIVSIKDGRLCMAQSWSDVVGDKTISVPAPVLSHCSENFNITYTNVSSSTKNC